jgi:uracil-DNA glycosylase family 4
MAEFDPACRRCARLAQYLDEGRTRYPAYHCRPVAPFGDPRPRLLVVGLAPGFHGANASGRPFTGDFAGILLYETLHACGWSSSPVSRSSGDGLELLGCRITNAVKCAPPANKPTTAEISTCNEFLAAELQALAPSAVILALGAVAHGAILRAFRLKAAAYAFRHGTEHVLPDGRTLFDSYHCSRYNTQTRRLSAAMFRDVVERTSTRARARDEESS